MTHGNTFLSGFDKAYKEAKSDSRLEAEETPTYESVSDGRYEAVVVGMGWRDFQNRDDNKWSGMGPIVRMRITGTANGDASRFVGWSETVTFFIVTRHPEKGVVTPELNKKKLDFFIRQMRRLGVDTPDSISDLASWGNEGDTPGPVGKRVLLTIKSSTSGDRVYRNVYFDGIPPAERATDKRFPLERFGEESQSWDKNPDLMLPVPTLSGDDEIPF